MKPEYFVLRENGPNLDIKLDGEKYWSIVNVFHSHSYAKVRAENLTLSTGCRHVVAKSTVSYQAPSLIVTEYDEF